MRGLARLLVGLAATALPAVALPPAAGAAFPGANGRIAFDRSVGQSEYVYTVRPDGTKLIRLPCSKPAAGGRCQDREPGWSRDGRFLAVGNSAGIAILRANGEFVRQVVTDAALNPDDETSGDPAWAPGGGRLVFTRQADGESPNIYVVATNGTGLRRVAREAVEPAWSLHNRIAIGGFGLYTMNANGKKRRTVYSKEVTSQDWSPAGKRLVYVHDDRLFLVGARGKGRRALNPPDTLDRQDPVWSPNGRSVVYVRFGPGQGSRLLLRDLASGKTRAVVPNALNPDWQAR